MCVCVAVAVAFPAGCGDSPDQGSADDEPAGASQADKAEKAPKSISALKNYNCPGSIKLSGVVTATEITTVGVPCAEVAEVLSNNSKAGFTCFLTGSSARCSDGRKTIEYEQG